MSKIAVRCPKCQAGYSIDESLRSKKGRCPKCQTTFVLAEGGHPLPASSEPRAETRPEGRHYSTEDQVPAAWEPGDVILNLYEVRGVLGEGGMGTVYLVHHRGWNLDLAVKSPKPSLLSNPGAGENFEREAETWVNLGLHPHTVSCHYVRRLGGIPRVFAEYVEGGSLADWIRSGKLSEGGPEQALERMLDIAIQFAWGLHYAHEQGLIHQDVKPANVMMAEGGTAKVTDFGLARARTMAGEVSESARPGQSMMIPGAGLCTKEYASPEQLDGQKLTRRTDIWSWGVSMLQMFSRTFPKVGSAAPDLLESCAETGAEEPGLLAMPAGVVELLRHCFQEDPEARPRNMPEIATRLQGIFQLITGRSYPREAPNPAEALADSLNNRAVSLLDLGKHDQPEKLWEKALEVDPHHPEATYNLGLVEWRSGRIRDDTLLRRLREVGSSPANEEVGKYLLALAHLERGDCEAAEQLLSEIEAGTVLQDDVARARAVARQHLPESARLLRAFEQSGRNLQQLCFCLDGQVALAGCGFPFPFLAPETEDDPRLVLWEVATGRCLGFLQGQEHPVTSVAASIDGHLVVCGDMNGEVRLWDVTGGHHRQCVGHREPVTAVCLSGDDRLALSASWDKTLRLWEVASCRTVQTFTGHTDRVISACLSKSGRLAASGSNDETLRLWDVPVGRCLRQFDGPEKHRSRVTALCITSDDRHLLSAGHDGTLKWWDVETGRCLRMVEGHNGGVTALRLTPDERWAVSGSNDGTVRRWELATGRCLRTFESQEGGIVDVCLAPDGRAFISGASGRVQRRNMLQLWQLGAIANWQRAALALSRPPWDGPAKQAAYRKALAEARQALASGYFLAAAGCLRRARGQPGCRRLPDALDDWSTLYHRLRHGSLEGGWEKFRFVFDAHQALEDGARRLGGQLPFDMHSAVGQPQPISALHVARDCRHVLAASGPMLLLWEVGTGRIVKGLLAPGDVVKAVYLFRDGRHALVGGRTLMLLDMTTSRCIRHFEGHLDMVYSLCVTGDERYAISGGIHQALFVWDLATGRQLRALEPAGDVTSLSLCADERLFLSGGTDKVLRLWDVATGRSLRVFEGHQDYVTSVCLSPDGRYALSGSGPGSYRWTKEEVGDDHSVKLWDVARGVCLRTFAGHERSVNSVCFTAESRFAASASSDGAVKLWDLTTGGCLRTLEGHESGVGAVAATPEARFVVSAGADGTIRFWELDWELEANQPADWDDGASVHLEVFLTRHMPYAGQLPQEREPSAEDVARALTRGGKPKWTADDFQGLLYTLGCAGYGWLQPEGVIRELEKMAGNWKGPPPLPGT